MVRRRRDVAVARDRAWNRRLGLLAALVITPLVAIGALYSPLFAVRRVDVTGLRSLSAESVRKAASIGQGQAMVDLDVTAVADRVRGMALVASAQVSRRWPSRVAIRIVERTPRVALRVPSGWILADGTGRILVQTSILPAGVVEVRTGTGTPGTTGTTGASAAGGLLGPGLREGAALAMALDPTVAGRVRAIVSGPDGLRLQLASAGKDAEADVVFGSGDDSLAKQRALVALFQAGALRPATPARPVTPVHPVTPVRPITPAPTARNVPTGPIGVVIDLRVPDTPTVRTAPLSLRSSLPSVP